MLIVPNSDLPLVMFSTLAHGVFNRNLPAAAIFIGSIADSNFGIRFAGITRLRVANA